MLPTAFSSDRGYQVAQFRGLELDEGGSACPAGPEAEQQQGPEPSPAQWAAAGLQQAQQQQQQQVQAQQQAQGRMLAAPLFFLEPPSPPAVTSGPADVDRMSVESVSTSNSALEVGSAWVRGYRPSMEDTHIVELGLEADTALLGVFDGHGGAECAQFCAAHAANVLRSTPGWAAGDVARALRETFLQLDLHLAATCPSSSGTTCTLAVLRAGRVAVAGVGDSRCILFHNRAGLGGRAAASQAGGAAGSDGGSSASGGSTSSRAPPGLFGPKDGEGSRGGGGGDAMETSGGRPVPRQHKALSMTVDHKPDTPEEESRIRNAGGFVYQGRINACLNVSRALGDTQFKQSPLLPACEQQVSPEPDIREALINSTSDFLLLCSDGIWNSMNEKAVLRFVKQRLEQGDAPADVCRDLCKACLEPAITAWDNCTAILCAFKPAALARPAPAAPPLPHSSHHHNHDNFARHHHHHGTPGGAAGPVGSPARQHVPGCIVLDTPEHEASGHSGNSSASGGSGSGASGGSNVGMDL